MKEIILKESKHSRIIHKKHYILGWIIARQRKRLLWWKISAWLPEKEFDNLTAFIQWFDWYEKTNGLNNSCIPWF